MTHQRFGMSQASCNDHSSPRPIQKRYRFTAILLMMLAFFGFALTGCDIGDTLWGLIHTDGDVEAQVFPNERIRARTFVIDPNSFSIETEDDNDLTPFTVEVKDIFIIYTITADAIINFEVDGSAVDPVRVENNDLVIERPGTSGEGTLTIIDRSLSSVN